MPVGQKDKKAAPESPRAAGSLGHTRLRGWVSGYGRVGFRAGNPLSQLAKNKRPYVPTVGDRAIQVKYVELWGFAEGRSPLNITSAG